MIYLFGILFAALVAMSTVASCEHKKVGALTAQIEANKIEAKRLLEQAKAQGQLDAIASQKDYDDALKNLSDANRKYAGQLRDPGRRNSCPSATGPVAGVPEESATGSDISEQSGKFLRSEADRADIAATYAAKCREHALKPSIRDQVNSLRSKP